MVDSTVCIYYAYCLSSAGLYADRAHDNHFLCYISSTVRKWSGKKKFKADQMTDGFQPSGTQSCNISIRSVRRVHPIRRRFHLDPARMSEISAARWEGQRRSREGTVSGRSRRNFDLSRTRQDMFKAGPAVACANTVYTGTDAYM